jgi:hypothetical protein
MCSGMLAGKAASGIRCGCGTSPSAVQCESLPRSIMTMYPPFLPLVMAFRIMRPIVLCLGYRAY